MIDWQQIFVDPMAVEEPEPEDPATLVPLADVLTEIRAVLMFGGPVVGP